MRDPKRIPSLAERLATLWQAYPDMRMGQLVTMISARIGILRDPFYIEDTEWGRAIDELIEEAHRGAVDTRDG